MKISLITPIRNEEKNLARYLRAIEKIDYPRDHFEVLFVDSNSDDGTVEILKRFADNTDLNVKVVEIKEDKGKAYTRNFGATEAQYDHLLFVDCKCQIDHQAVKAFVKHGYNPAIGFVITSQDSSFGRFFYLMRLKLFNVNLDKMKATTVITPENFDQSPKGTTMFFCEKELFLNSQIENLEEKESSDDTKLLKNIVQKKPIHILAAAKVYYNNRQEFWENLKHTFSKGPRFVDYYYKPSKKEFWLINLVLLFFGLVIWRLLEGTYFWHLIITALVLNSAVALFLAKNIKDFFIVFALFPLITITFLLGNIKGILKEARKKIIPTKNPKSEQSPLPPLPENQESL